MILLDCNLLLYAVNPSAPQHEPSRRWLTEQFNGPTRVGIPWHTLLGFLRLSTDPRLHPVPAPVGAACRTMQAWLACPVVWIPQPTERHADVLGGLLEELGQGGKLVPDAHLAALAIEHGLTLCSTDGDFARFRGLRWLNPLAARG